jgi:hypothetical protein
MPSTFEYAISIILPLQLTWLCSCILSDDETENDNNTVTAARYLWQWCLFVLLDATYGHLFHVVLLVPSRWIARRLPGAVVPAEDAQCTIQEEEANDASLVWPSDEALSKLPDGWVVVKGDYKAETYSVTDIAANTKGTNVYLAAPSTVQRRNTKKQSSKSKGTRDKDESQSDRQKETAKRTQHQPYFLNHARGSTRIRQASQRIGAACGTILASHVISSFSRSSVSLEDIGLVIKQPFSSIAIDLWNGVCIGASIVAFIFIVELMMEWIKIIGYFETVTPKEKFAVNFTWDVLFHLGVSINEEVMLRGWMFTLGARGLWVSSAEWFIDGYTAAIFATVSSVILQSTLFSLLHFSSPGSTAISLLNLFLGGVAASLNTMVAGGSLWLGIGWHFGWNIMMGHVLGRSTSGIPMSCAVVSVVPKPTVRGVSCESLHGGTFGPELGVLAPFAYVLGMVMVIYVYGWEGLREWREELIKVMVDPLQ